MISGLSPSVQALVVIGVVLVEAVVLYVGYGALEDRIAPPLLQRIQDI